MTIERKKILFDSYHGVHANERQLANGICKDQEKQNR